jgi:ankyrin repeat protein
LAGTLRRSALDYLLGNAVAYNHLARAEWLLRHGADPNGPHAYSARPLRVEALVYGHTEMAELLERFGAAPTPLEGHAAFAAAVLRLDRAAAQALVRQDPTCLDDAEPMRRAARTGRADVVALLLDLGMNVDVTDATGVRGVQDAVAGNAIEVVRLLVAHGTEIDRVSKHYGGALGFAAHFGRRDIAELLAPLSRDVHNLTTLAMKERLRELFAAEPALVNARRATSGVTPLFMLPDDEDEALEMTAFLLEAGAHPALANAAGVTAIEAARARGLLDAAELMEERANAAATG